MAMNTALSGLQAAQTDIDATAHNIANAGTAGFRSSRVLFADVFSSSPEAVARTAVGSGVQVTKIDQDFKESAVEATGRALDLSIQGAGFFAVQTPPDSTGNGGRTLYTRTGDFKLDADGALTNSAGNHALGWPVSSTGTALSQTAAGAGALHVPFALGEVAATTTVNLDVALPSDPAMTGGQTAVPPAAGFDPADPTSWAYRTPVALVGAAGQPVEAQVFFTKVAAPSATAPDTVWRAQLMVGSEVLTSAAADFTFNAGGGMTTAMPLSFTAADGSALSLDLTGTGLADGAFAVQAVHTDGTTPAKLKSVEVDATGTIWASYGTGDPVAVGQLMVATFANPQGLMQTGNTSFAATRESGTAIVGSAQSPGFGKMRSGGLEGSNVDLTVELVDLITAQRNYQASAKALETSSSLMKTIMNISS